MYHNNIYVKAHKEIDAIKGTSSVNAKLDIYDSQHGLKRNEFARAQYFDYLAKVYGNDKYLSPYYKEILEKGE